MTIKNRQQMLAILAVVGVGLLIADKVLITPLLAGWKERAGRIAELRKSVAQGEALIQRGDRIRERWGGMRTNTLPDDVSAAENLVLKAFERWSDESRISISGIKPQWKRTTEDYMTLECRADAFGSIHALTRFLYSLEKDPLALRVESVEINSRDENGQQLALAIQVTGLLLNPQEP
ncbi:MAG TPA: hypothetical protein VJS65_08140 [Verrucomicrobiae bacterium]|nr:hypothetical protein [Verrucomicrobiae bacterium]